MTFNPKIIGFLCNWCSYAGADLAGVSRIQYPPNIRIVRVMCSGRVEPYFIFKAIEEGIDGIIIMGCHPGECHYLSGNLEAEVKFAFLQKLMKYIGLEERIRLEWVSASEGIRFGDIVKKFTADIQSLGASPFNFNPVNAELVENLQVLKAIADNYRLRALIGRKRALIEDENVYHKKLTKENFEVLLDDAIRDEYFQEKIYQRLQNEAASVKSLASSLMLDPSQIMEYIVDLKKKGKVDLLEIQELSPIYVALQEG